MHLSLRACALALAATLTALASVASVAAAGWRSP